MHEIIQNKTKEFADQRFSYDKDPEKPRTDRKFIFFLICNLTFKRPS